MIKKYLINLLLIGLIIGLYWFNNQNNVPVDVMPQLTPLVSTDIKTITISRSDSTEIILNKSSSAWQIIQPINAPANNSRIDLLLSFLNTPSYAQIDASNSNLSQFELAPANITLGLDTQIIQFGGVEPISKHRYVLINNVIHLITDRITPLLSANAASFIENKLISRHNTITKITFPLLNSDNSFSNSSASIENISGHWRSSLAKTTSDQLSAYIENWQHAYAIQVLPLNSDDKKGATNKQIQLWYQGESQPVEFELKLSNNALFIIDRQQHLNYQFPLALLPKLLPSRTIAP